MALALPLNFSRDIQGRDTSLQPIILIGKRGDPSSYTYISTGFHPSAGLVQGYPYYPILLNIPSLKESIDIEKRNYKISSINIDISNFPYEGKRFSELVDDSSLINTECRIYWFSPSTTTHGFDEEYIDLENQEGSDAWGLQVFFGSIRRYTHDDEKVRLVVEDRSQATLHKDLPTAELGFGDDVPDKYKNKPIPMVYGHVDRSPCVIKATEEDLGLDYDDTILIRSAEIIIDSNDVANNLNTGTFEGIEIPTSGLFIEESDAYLSVAQNSELNFGTKVQWQVESATSPRILLVPLMVGVNEADNFIADGNIEIVDVNWATKLSIRTEGDYEEGSVYLTDRDKLLDDDANSSMVSGEYAHNAIGLGGDGYVGFYLMFDPPPYSESDKYVQNVSNYLLQKFYTEIHSTTPDAYNLRVNDTGSTSIADDGLTLDGSTVQQVDNIVLHPELSKTWEIWNNTLGENRLFYWTGDPDLSSQFTTHIPEINYYRVGVLRNVVIEKYTDKVFYANVNGRAMNGELSPTAPSVIKHILENELDVTGIDVTGTYTWKYAFTVDKKINSKKLIEGIASVSPYIPRFNNIGEFKFDVIPELYTESRHTIEESDVIDFSFTRTKIEDVFTKIEFKYNWDYAREDFNNQFTVYLNFNNYFLNPDHVASNLGIDWDYLNPALFSGFYSNYSYDYYGLKTDDSESTLVIDDDRGKYIRESNTAKYFAKHLLLWSCNQHLKMKVKLPLKYMDVEIGDIVDFNKVINDIKPYGIDYGRYSTYLGSLGNVLYYGDNINATQAYPSFIVTSTNKTLEWVEIECFQLHNLTETHEPGSVLANDECEGEIDDCGVCNGDNTSCLDECGVPNGGGYEICWDGELVCNLDDCSEGIMEGVCINDGVNLGQMSEGDCLNSMVHIMNGCSLPENSLHINPDGSIVYNIGNNIINEFSFHILESPSALDPNGDNWNALQLMGIMGHWGDEVYSGQDYKTWGCWFEIPDFEGIMEGQCDIQGSEILSMPSCPDQVSGTYDPGLGAFTGCGFLTGITMEDGIYPSQMGITTHAPYDGFYYGGGDCSEASSELTMTSELYPVITFSEIMLRGSGDLNLDGKADISDMVLMGNHLSGNNDLDNKQFVIADILRNNNVSILDVVNLANMIVGGTYSG